MMSKRKEYTIIIAIVIVNMLGVEAIGYFVPDDHLSRIDQRLQDRFHAIIVLAAMFIGYVIYRLIKKKIARGAK